MLRFVLGGFFLLHGMVFLLYAGQALRLFELQPGLVWPERAWAFSRSMGERATRILAAVACGLAAVGFAVIGAALLVRQPWWGQLAGGVAAFSVVVFVLLWDGTPRRLSDQGWIGVLLNVAIVIAAYVFHWPGLDF